MRIVHTSDWHLGRSFGSTSLLADQEAFCDWFVEFVGGEGADLVVIAGDLYDRSVAPKEAITLFRDTVKRLLAAGAQVAAITGNHDGADRVAPYGGMLDGSGFVLRGGYDLVGEVISLEFPDGPLDVALLPFLDPRAAPDAFGFEAGSGAEGADGSALAPGAEAGVPDADLMARRQARTHESVLAVAAARARASCTPGRRSLAVAHAHVTGGEVSDSERQLVVGGTGAVDAPVFDGFSYVALGHLHRPQRVAGAEHVRYSGTPLPYSFSEEHEKSVCVVDLAPDGSVGVRAQPVPVGRPVRTLAGTMAELLDPGAHPGAHDAFVRAIVTDRETVLDARARLGAVYPHVVEVQLRPDGQLPVAAGAASAEVARRAPIEVVRAFWEEVEGGPPSAEVDRLLVEATTLAAEAVVS